MLTLTNVKDSPKRRRQQPRRLLQSHCRFGGATGLRFTAFLLRRRYAVLTLLLLVTAGFAAVLPRAVIATNFSELFFSKDAAFDTYLRRTHDMTNDHGLFVGLDEDEPLAPAALDRLKRAVDAITAMKEVRRVTSLLDAGTLHDDGTDLTYPKFADEARAHPERAAERTAALAADPLWARTVISADGKHTAMFVEILPDESRKAEAETELVANIRAALAAAGYPQAAVHVGGTSAVTAEMFNQVYKNLTRVFPIAVVVLFGVGFLMFRQIWPVVITTLIAFIAVIWTSGFALLLDPKVNLFMSIVPIIILVISFSDVIHLCSAYLLELDTGKSKIDAILATGSDVGVACLLTSATTFIGFASLAFVPSPVMLLFSFVAIALVMMIGLRSLRNGALSMLPNVLPLAFLGGYVGLTRERADSDMMIVAMIAIGIAVDDTIHYMMRFRIESQRTSDVVAAARETFHFAGRAIVITTVILVAGFAPLIMSDYYTFFMFGTLLPLTLVAALAADLFLTPALTALGWIRYPQKADAVEAAKVG